jgi:hypothetical protein
MWAFLRDNQQVSGPQHFDVELADRRALIAFDRSQLQRLPREMVSGDPSTYLLLFDPLPAFRDCTGNSASSSKSAASLPSS